MTTIQTIDHSQLYFVFGSNLAGRHGKGAALTAERFFHAERGVGEGLSGQSYALPTKDQMLKSRSLSEIGDSVKRFVEVAYAHPDKTFMVTRVGCGLAGFEDEAILQCFDSTKLPSNVLLSGVWLSLLHAEQTPRVIIAGGRDFYDYGRLRERTNHLLSGLTGKPITIVSGTQKGADMLGENYWHEGAREEPERWSLTRFPPNWDRFEKAAGPLRNAAMAWYATHLIAFWNGRSRGTKNMITTAEAERLKVRVVQ